MHDLAWSKQSCGSSSVSMHACKHPFSLLLISKPWHSRGCTAHGECLGLPPHNSLASTLKCITPKEPVLLKEEKQHIERSLQATAVSNYGAFIETAHCLNTINTEVGSVCERLDALLQVRGCPSAASLVCRSYTLPFVLDGSVFFNVAASYQYKGANPSGHGASLCACRKRCRVLGKMVGKRESWKGHVNAPGPFLCSMSQDQGYLGPQCPRTKIAGLDAQDQGLLR